MYEAKYMRESLKESEVEGRTELFKGVSGSEKLRTEVVKDLNSDPKLEEKLATACKTLGSTSRSVHTGEMLLAH